MVRARDAVRQDLMRCRHRLSKLLLRHGHRFEEGPAWTDRHRAWVAGIEFPFAAESTTGQQRRLGSITKSSTNERQRATSTRPT